STSSDGDRVASQTAPQFRRETEGIHIDSLVYAVEHRRIVFESKTLAEQPEPVRDGAESPEYAGVCGSDCEKWDQPATWIRFFRSPFEGGPKRGVGGRCRSK